MHEINIGSAVHTYVYNIVKLKENSSFPRGSIILEPSLFHFQKFFPSKTERVDQWMVEVVMLQYVLYTHVISRSSSLNIETK